MRDDFAKVLVERPRLGGGRLRKGRPPRAGQPCPKTLGLRRAVVERGYGKELNENLAPLRRYLARQVGRPWNKVHSERPPQAEGSAGVGVGQSGGGDGS